MYCSPAWITYFLTFEWIAQQYIDNEIILEKLSYLCRIVQCTLYMYSTKIKTRKMRLNVTVWHSRLYSYMFSLILAVKIVLNFADDIVFVYDCKNVCHSSAWPWARGLGIWPSHLFYMKYNTNIYTHYVCVFE